MVVFKKSFLLKYNRNPTQGKEDRGHRVRVSQEVHVPWFLQERQLTLGEGCVCAQMDRTLESEDKEESSIDCNCNVSLRWARSEFIGTPPSSEKNLYILKASQRQSV